MIEGGIIFNSLRNQSGQGSSTPHFFKPVSVFTSWNLMQVVNNTIAKARERSVYASTADYGWTKHYEDKITTNSAALKYWNLMPDTSSQARPTMDKRFSETFSIEKNIKIALRDIMTSG